MSSPTPQGNSGPQIPATLAEAVYSALDYALTHLHTHGSMPKDMVENLGKVAMAYDRSRTYFMVQRGVPPAVVEKFSRLSADKLEAWMGKQEKKVETSNADFERWARELSDGEDTA